ncbi:uncharacterized protein F5147DRAFT_821961 [Suillus discolor]|uniref:Uncharacterized protein n=1 Tax=Suillus discolor TaxID=1912936 RepID=A0A9P7FEQ8_9AGAM|nr:uncharacterized protein F5147DRAFT_821961 [Suillus discolor]KAG2114635.1 hypothetical protein F5147DRAFT_821961 [Suillus discolor]
MAYFDEVRSGLAVQFIIVTYSQLTNSQDSYRLPEGIKRIAYDADTQQYIFRDRSGQLYQNPSGETYGVLIPVSAPATPRRSVTITGEDPALIRARSVKRPAKTFDDFLPREYITNAKESSPTPNSPSEDITRANRNRALPKIPKIGEVIRSRAISPRESADEEKRYLLDNRSASPTSYATHDDEKELSRSNSKASSMLSLPIIDTHINLSGFI